MDCEEINRYREAATPWLSDGGYLYDVSRLPYEDWLDFFFDRPLIGEGAYWPEHFLPPHSRNAFEFQNPTQLVSHIERMCSDFKLLANRYSLTQLNQAIWAMLGPDFECGEVLWDGRVDVGSRCRAIRTMLIPYRDVVAPSDAEVMENCFDMWWDFLGEGFWWHLDATDKSDKTAIQEGRREFRQPTPEESRLHDAMFETLSEILRLSDSLVQYFALHGLGHVRHPRGARLVQDWLDEHRSKLSEDEVRWVEQCRDGTVM